jgi:hypothetical protein
MTTQAKARAQAQAKFAISQIKSSVDPQTVVALIVVNGRPYSHMKAADVIDAIKKDNGLE